jgi:hypothetical protein
MQYANLSEIQAIGDTLLVPVSFSVNGVPVDLSGSTVYFSLVEDLAVDTTPIATDTVDDFSSWDTGEVVGEFFDTTTEGLTEGTYYVIIKWKDAENHEKTTIALSVTYQAVGAPIP